MSDFDFDELDRAVSGAIGSDSSDEIPKPVAADTDRVSAPAPVSAPATPPSITSSSEAEKPVVSSPITRSAPAARRSSGRFMDMVHPSSDMRTRETPAIIPAPQPEPVTPSAPEVSEPKLAPTDINNDLAAPAEDPLASPFLPDAKVEKRPLGGGTPIASDLKLEDLLDEPDDPLLGTGKQETLIEGPDDPLLSASTMPDPIDFAESLTSQQDNQEQEVNDEDVAKVEDTVVDTPSELPSLETEEATPVATTPEATPSESEVAAELLETTEATTPQEQEAGEESAESHAEPTPTAEAEQPVGPTSITQQYTEQPSSKQESGAIYDTESYHQPLAKPAKKHSGMLVIVWILLLVILGAGAGAAFYLYVLPML